MKHNYLKHLFTALLLLCCSIANAHDFEVDGIYYNILSEEDKTVEVTFKGSTYTSYTNEYTGSVVILPSSVTYDNVTYSVISIGANTFRGCKTLTDVQIPNSVTSIGSYAFYYCNITSVVIPNGVKVIADYAFYGCTGLVDITIGSSVTSIAKEAFINTAWYNNQPNGVIYTGNVLYDYKGEMPEGTNIVIKEGTLTIGDDVFEDCTGLISITIPNSVTTIEDGAFYRCTGLTSITIPNSITYIGNYAFSGCIGLTSVTIPNSVTNIGFSAFAGCSNLANIEMPSSAVNLDANVFAYTAWYNNQPNGVVYAGNVLYKYKGTMLGGTNISVNEGTLSIAGAAFWDDCHQLTSISIPNSVIIIGKEAFYNCSGLTSIEIPNSVTSIEERAFEGCSGLTSVTSNATTAPELGENAFSRIYSSAVLRYPAGSDYSSWSSYFASTEEFATTIGGSCGTDVNWTYADGVLTISGSGAMDDFTSDNLQPWKEYCESITTVLIQDGVTSIGNSALCNCINLTSLTIGNDVKTIGEGAFTRCYGLTSIEIPNSITSIGDHAFNSCRGLTSIVIPNSVTSIGGNAFSHCTGLTSIEIPNSVTSIEDSAFYGCTGLTSIEIPNSVTSIEDYAFYGCEGLTSIVIPNSVTSIGGNAFSYCSGLKSIEIPNSVTSIGIVAFYGCEGLEEVHISDLAAWCNIEMSDWSNPLNYAQGFYLNGELLTEIIIPEGVTSIGSSVFNGYSNLTSIDIPNSVTSIGYCAFFGCTGLTSIEIPNSVTSIEEWAFNGCTGLTSIEIPNSVTSIGERAFYGCTGLTSIEIPNSVTSIEEWAFSGCSDLTSVTSNATTAPAISYNTFSNIPSSAVLRYPAGSDYSSWEPYFASTEVFGAVTGITLSASEAELKAGETLTLTASVAPEDAFVKSVTWSSSNEAVAIVDQNGVVTAVAAGDAIITATANDGSEVSATCNVTVAEEQSGDNDEVVTYDNTIYATDTEAKTGTQVYLSICMDNVVDITSFQFDLYLPEGITIAKDEDDFHIIELSERATSRHTYESGDMADGAVRVICYSTKNTVFSGNTGEVLSIPVNVSSDLADGEYEILVKEIELSTPAEVAYNVPAMASKISVFSYITGDVNGDDKISVTDITGLVNLILSGADYTENRAADVNEDGKISVTDITGIVNLILNSTNSTASAAPAQRVSARAAASTNTMQIAPFAISAGEEKEVYVLMDNPGDAFCGFQFNVYLPDGVELLSDEYGYLVDLGSRTTSRKHVVECAEQADGSILVLCYSSKNSTFSYESGDVLVLPVKAADDLEAGVYELVMTDIEMVRPDESNEFPADYFASVVAGDGGATELVLDGYFTADAMSEISGALEAKSDIVSVDITGAVYVDSEGSLTTGNSNTLVQLPSGESIANESNVVVDGFCQNLQLTDKMPFNAPVEFTAVNASYSRSFAAPTTATFVLPVAVPTAAVNGKVYKLSGYEGDLIKFSRVTEESLEANVPYVVVVEAAAELLNSTLTNAEVVATPEDISVESGEIKHVGAYRTQEVVSGAETYYGYSGGMFVKANNGTLYPFRTMIAANGDAAFSNSYRTDFGEGTTGIDSVGAEEDDAIYFDLQGRRVKRTENGVFIINGKKTFIK